MSPIEIGAPTAEEVQEATDQEIEALLMDEDGKLTLEGEVVQGFLDFVEWDDLFEDDEFAKHIREREAFIVPIDDGADFEEVEEGTEGAEKIIVQEIDGETLAAIVDEDDLVSMFGYYVQHLPEDTLEDKARKAVFGALEIDEELAAEIAERGMMPGYSQSEYAKKYGDKKKKKGSAHGSEHGGKYEGDADEAEHGNSLRAMMMKKKKKKPGTMTYGEADEDAALDEGPFKRGAFRKIHKAGGKDQVARMLIAMMKKEVIRRAPGGPGSGYKKGDYKKFPGGYATGTAKGLKKHRAYLKKSKAKVLKAAKKAKKGKRIAGRFAAKAKSKKGAGVLAKKKKGTEKLVASAPAPSGNRLLEGASMAAAVVSHQERAERIARGDSAEKKDDK